MSDKVTKHTEFEVKFKVEPHTLIEFKRIVDSLECEKQFVYVEGPDYYYTHPDQNDNTFARYRKPSYGLDNGRSEVTIKIKPEGAKNNIIRKELNWRVDKTPEDTIKEGLEILGFVFNFSIHKTCQIYNLPDATLVHYTVYDTTDGKPSGQHSFVEIEVSEDNIHNMTEAEAWAVIEKYEAVLSPIGINAHKRLKKSLFEMFRRAK